MATQTQTIIKLEEVGTKKPLYGYKCKIVISQNGKIIKTYEAVTSNLGIINVRSGFGVTIALIKDKDGKAKQIGKFLSNSTEKSIYYEIKAPKAVIHFKKEGFTMKVATSSPFLAHYFFGLGKDMNIEPTSHLGLRIKIAVRTQINYLRKIIKNDITQNKLQKKYLKPYNLTKCLVP